MDDKKRKVIIVEKRAVAAPVNLEVLINDALSIIGNELAFYNQKTKKGMTLQLKEAKAVQGYMDSLVKMSREAREAADQERTQKLAKLSDAELFKIAQEQLKSGAIENTINDDSE
jgi:hypothetical protein